MGFECYRIGDLLLDAGTQEVTRNGTIVQVPRLSFKLLLSLVRHAPNVVSVEQLESEVWAGLVVDRGTVNKRVLLLRKALGEDNLGEPYIAVVRGSGYRLVSPVECLESCPEEGAPNQNDQEKRFGLNPVVKSLVFYGLPGIVAVMILYLVFRMVFSVPDEPVLAGDAVTRVQPIAYSQRSIAVLPFIDLSENHAHQYIGDGIAEEVINLLGGMSGLNVAARTSSFAFRDSATTALEIASRLRVGTLLEGSIRHADGRIRVSAQLVDAQTGYHIWSQNYDHSFEQVFDVQDDIALNIAQSLKLTMVESEQPDSGRSMTSNIEAFEIYLKGRELLNDRIHLRSDGLIAALGFFQAAIEMDPKFARAHAGVATVNWLLTSYDETLDPEPYLQKAEASAKFALALNPASTDALGALASVSAKRGDIEQAAKLFNQIRAIGSEDSNIAAWEAQLLVRLGYFEEVIAPLEEVYARDPLNEVVAWSLAGALIFSGKPVAAANILQGLEHFSYRDYCLGLSAIYTGNYVAARELLRDVQMRAGVLPAVYADMLIDALEDPTLVEHTAAAFVSASSNGTLERLVSFEALLVLGSPRAFDLGIEPFGDIAKVQIHSQVWNNWAVALRRDSRFKDWVSALGYVDFWRKFGWPDRCQPTGLDDFECI